MIASLLVPPIVLAIGYGLGRMTGSWALPGVGTPVAVLLQLVLFCGVLVGGFALTDLLLHLVDPPRYSGDADSLTGALVTLADNVDQATRHFVPSVVTGFLAAIIALFSAQRAFARTGNGDVEGST
ncbi:MAG: hypothetical protein HLUCCA08_09940 [Rhodobacteraceae bacterium HLUCCA08]|nr:MAG: hypothetical protein HLUCCA08_09940 [Rhodobacteraceae bacterium HLUCCA08]